MSKRDLITKDFALYVVHYFNSMQTWSKKDILNEIDRTINEAKPDDAIRVVRCKNCKHTETDGCGEPAIYCKKWDRWEMPEDFFCAFGERKINAMVD